MNSERELLILLLQKAYSGELAAALAYIGHWKSVKSESERIEIQKIEADEWRHRELVGGLLSELGSGPDMRLERKMKWTGRIIGRLCYVSGWFFPMYGAGLLERKNIVEYETAARHAEGAGLSKHVPCLLEMAELEWDHELFFRTKAASHFLARLLPMWSPPPPRENIRASFAAAA